MPYNHHQKQVGHTVKHTVCSFCIRMLYLCRLMMGLYVSDVFAQNITCPDDKFSLDDIPEGLTFSISNSHVINDKLIIGNPDVDFINRYGNKPYQPDFNPYEEQQTVIGFGGWSGRGLTCFINKHTSVNTGLCLAAMHPSHDGYKHRGLDATRCIQFIFSNLFPWS